MCTDWIVHTPSFTSFLRYPRLQYAMTPRPYEDTNNHETTAYVHTISRSILWTIRSVLHRTWRLYILCSLSLLFLDSSLVLLYSKFCMRLAISFCIAQHSFEDLREDREGSAFCFELGFWTVGFGCWAGYSRE
jgi:hypothetical protein